MTTKGKVKTAGLILLVGFLSLVVARIDQRGPYHFSIAALAVVGAIVTALLVIWVQRALTVKRLSRKAMMLPLNSVSFLSWGSSGLRADLISFDPNLHKVLPAKMPSSILCSLDEEGISLWLPSGSQEGRRVTASWSECAGVEVEESVSPQDRIQRALVVSGSNSQFRLPILGGFLHMWAVGPDRAQGIKRRADMLREAASK